MNPEPADTDRPRAAFATEPGITVEYGDEPWSVRQKIEATGVVLRSFRIVDSAPHIIDPHDAVEVRAEPIPASAVPPGGYEMAPDGWQSLDVSPRDWRVSLLLARLKKYRDDGKGWESTKALLSGGSST